MKKNYFAGRIAETYDDSHAPMFSDEVINTTVDFLKNLAGDGEALEFAIGTGRIGYPLHQRGVPVTGIEFSNDMVQQLRQKPGAEDIHVTIGDMASAKVKGSYSLVYLVYNTINNVTTQDAQVECFINASTHLNPGGYFVIETGVPMVNQRLQSLPGQKLQIFNRDENHIGIDEFDIVNQNMISHHYTIKDGEARLHSIPFRYASPAEFDLMARIAGMRLKERWNDWDRSPFTDTSTKHVSVWEKM